MLKRETAVIDTDYFHAKFAGGGYAESGKVKGRLLRLAPTQAPVVATTEERVVSFIFSDDSVDRYGDTIDARGWDLASFLENPVALYGHDPSQPGNVIGKARNVRVQGNRLLGDIVFMEAAINPIAETVYLMVKGGYLNAVSVGFQPIEWVAAKDKSRPGGIDFKKQQLLEISIVAIPANENALVQARAAGLDVASLGLDRSGPAINKKGLYEVSWLANLLESLGYLSEMVAWEAEYEGDGSEVPAMLAGALNQLGAALVAMTAEEVSELLAGDEETPILADDTGQLEGVSPAQKAFVQLAKIAREASAHKRRRYVIQAPQKLSLEKLTEILVAYKDWLAGRDSLLILDAGVTLREVDQLQAEPAVRSAPAAVEKAGKTLSAATKKTISDAHESITKGCDMLKGMMEPDDDNPADDPALEPDDMVTDAAAVERRRRRAKAIKASVETST